MTRLSSSDFRWDNFSWTTDVSLARWRSVNIVFAPEGRDDAPLRDDEVALVEWLVAHQAEAVAAVLDGVFGRYDAIRASYAGAFEPEHEATVFPTVASAEELLDVIEIVAVHVHQIDRGGVPYLGFEFSCPWDVEHGLGVLMHGTRLVDMGGADTAIMLWVARRDAERA